MAHSLTYNDMLGAYAPYPAPIRPYLLRAETHPALNRLLTKSFMRVFIDILGRAPIANPLRALRLRIDVIAKNLDISTRTVDRALSFFKEQGWLSQDVRCDGRNRFGEFCTKEFILSTDLRNMLGLPTETTLPQTIDQEELSVDNSASETKLSHGLYRVNKVFKKEASFQQGASSIKNQQTNLVSATTSQPPVTANPSASTKQPKLPADLIEMAETLQITPHGICALMRLAKQANQRLQDVWRVKRDQLLNSGAKEGRAFCYLRHLLSTGEDFAFRARNKVIGLFTVQEVRPAALIQKKEADDVRHYWNKKYVGENGLRVRIHEGGSAEVQSATRNPSYISPRDMDHVYDAIRSNKLRLVEE